MENYFENIYMGIDFQSEEVIFRENFGCNHNNIVILNGKAKLSKYAKRD